jgi:DNA repair exonuclease SbcCD nuclease subunit
MTRFLYITDTHLGADPMSWQQQQGYPQKLPQIISALRDYVSTDGQIDFVLHGGDMIDTTTDANIVACVERFDLPVPVYLCLGNHDLTSTHALKQWLKLAPEFFKDGSPDYTITTEDCVIHVAPNQWCDDPYFWDGEQRPHLSPSQEDRLARELGRRTELPHLILTHSPVHGLPIEQTGFDAPHDCPPPSFTSQISDLAASHAHVCGVLGGHNHVNMAMHHRGADYVTVSSLVETPFEFKLFEVTPERITMSTVSLGPVLKFEGDYDASKSFVQGRSVDRGFSRAL